MKRLPDSEFEIMKAVWACEPPITCIRVMDKLNRPWKAPSVISFLNRLVEKGFLRTEKLGKERAYEPLIERESYLRFETEDFIHRYHGNSLSSLVSALADADLDEADIDELLEWARNRR